MDAREPLALTAAPARAPLGDLLLPLVIGALLVVAVAALALGAIGEMEAVVVVLFVAAMVGGPAVALGARLLGRSLGPAEAVDLPRHRGFYRYEAGSSGILGALAIGGFLLTALLRGGQIIGPPALLCLVLGVVVAPIVFIVQRRRSARALPPSIR
jgi:hypothetical protein